MGWTIYSTTPNCMHPVSTRKTARLSRALGRMILCCVGFKYGYIQHQTKPKEQARPGRGSDAELRGRGRW